MAELERVEHHDVAAGVAQAAHGVRADVAGPAGDEHAHAVPRLSVALVSLVRVC